MKNLIMFLLLLPAAASAGQATLAWDRVDDSRVDVYELHWGTASGAYDTQIDEPQAADPEINSGPHAFADGSTYHIAVRACTSDRALCSEFSNELEFTPTDDYPGPGTLRIIQEISSGVGFNGGTP